MIYSPVRKAKKTDILNMSTTLSKISPRVHSQTYNDSMIRSASSRSTNPNKIIKRLSISVKKKRLQSPVAPRQSPRIPYHLKYKVNIQTKKSSQSHNQIGAYGISSFKGFRNVMNSHHIGVNLGYVKCFNLIQSFEGTMAGQFVKKQYPMTLMNLATGEIRQKPQLYLEKANEQVQQKLMEKQIAQKDNSGCTLISVIVDSDFITVSNCGVSQVICETRSDFLLKLNQQHDTKNQNELDRIIKNGGTIYKTVVNIPYEKDFMVEGPLRLSPSGLSLTRTLGRTFDYKTEAKDENYGRKVTWVPHITYVKTSEVKWFGIFSQSVISIVKDETIRQIINGELRRRSENYTIHHIAGQCSRMVVNEAISQGAAESVSAIVIITLKDQPQKLPYHSLKQEYQDKKEEKVVKIRSLKYIGNRASFVKKS